jgi:putative hemolysin
MVHRSGVVAINLDMEPREIMQIIQNEGFSRLPVFHHAIDEITGVLHVKDLLPHIAQLERLSVPSQNGRIEFFTILERAVRTALFVSETQTLQRLLLEFQKSRMHMGIVVSEHGGVEGIVTLEDILEELVGEIHDESDAPNEEREVIEIGNALYVIPTLSVSDFNERFEDRFQRLEESAEYSTLSGYVQKISGRIPNVGDVIEAEGLRFTITRKVRHRLQQIKIERCENPVGESVEVDNSPSDTHGSASQETV